MDRSHRVSHLEAKLSFDFGQPQVLPQLPGLVTGHVRPRDARGGPRHVAAVERGSVVV